MSVPSDIATSVAAGVAAFGFALLMPAITRVATRRHERALARRTGHGPEGYFEALGKGQQWSPAPAAVTRNMLIRDLVLAALLGGGVYAWQHFPEAQSRAWLLFIAGLVAIVTSSRELRAPRPETGAPASPFGLAERTRPIAWLLIGIAVAAWAVIDFVASLVRAGGAA